MDAGRAGRDRAPDRMQRLLSRAAWDAAAVIRAVRRFAVAGLDQAARGGRRGLAVGARAAGCRWPVEEDFRSGKGCFGLDESQVRLFTAIARHTALVMAALAICAVTAALLRRPAPPPHRHPGTRPGPAGPAPVRRPGAIPLTVPETARCPPIRPRLVLAGTGWPGAAATRPCRPGTTSAPGSPETNRFSWSASDWLARQRPSVRNLRRPARPRPFDQPS